MAQDIYEDRDLDLEIPLLVLQGATLDDKDAAGLKTSLRDAHGPGVKLDIFGFEKFYDFHVSATFDRLCRAKLVVTPSIVESFGLTSLEAASLGIPLIAPRQSGFCKDLEVILGNAPENCITWLYPRHFKSKRRLRPTRLSA